MEIAQYWFKVCFCICVSLSNSLQQFLGHGLRGAGRLGLGYGNGLHSLEFGKYGGIGQLGLFGGLGGLAYGIPLYKIYTGGAELQGGFEHGGDIGPIGGFGGVGEFYKFYDPELEFHLRGNRGGFKFENTPTLGLLGGLGGIAYGTQFGDFGGAGGFGDDIDIELAGLKYKGGGGFGGIGGIGRSQGGRGFGKKLRRFGGGGFGRGRFGKFGIGQRIPRLKKYGGRARLGLIGGGIGGLAYGRIGLRKHFPGLGRHYGKYVKYEDDDGGSDGFSGFGYQFFNGRGLGAGGRQLGGFHDPELALIEIEHEIELQKPVFMELEFDGYGRGGSCGSEEFF